MLILPRGVWWPVATRAATLVLLAMAMLLATAATVAAAVNDETNGLVPTVATTERLEAAEEIDKEELTGLSKEQPNICTGVEINRDLPLTPASPRSGVGVFPAQVEVDSLKPGSSYRSCVVVVNTADTQETYQLSTIELIGSPDPDVGLELQLDPVSIGTWIHPLVTKVTVPPGASVEIPYLIDVPQTVPAGSVIGGLRLTSAPSGTESTAFANSVVHRVYGTFPGGQNRRLDVTDVSAPRLLSKRKGDLAYRAKYIVTNKGAIVDVFSSELVVRGLGRKVASAKTDPAVLLPDSAARQELVWRNLPWIGWYSPKVTIVTRNGNIDVPVPRVLILPPRPYVIALVAALLLPLVWFIWRTVRRRREWMQYIDEDDDDAIGEDDEADPYWDPPAGT